MNKDMSKRFDKQFTYASFCWNGDNATGVKCAKDTKRKLKSFISEALDTQRKEIIDEVEKWCYTYTDYMTKMSTKKDFEKGNIAKELADTLINILSNHETK